MAVRPIDGDAVKRRAWDIAEAWKDQGRDYEALLLESVVEQIVDTQPTLTPPNEPEYREYTCPYCYHTWLEDRDASDYPNYCPVCRAVLRDGSAPPNDALTLEQLQEMDGEPVWFDTIKRWGIVRVCGYGISVLTKSGEYDVTRMKFYRRPPEGEEET